MSFLRWIAILLTTALMASGTSHHVFAIDSDYIVVQSTTSTQNSGLLDNILPQFELQTGIEVRVVAVGTGQAIRNASNGDGDVLLVHSKTDEIQFVSDGWGVERFDVMYNDFVLVGPAQDPANVAGGDDIVVALQAIADERALFVSRGDDSGTHKAEVTLWDETGVNARKDSGNWYREAGSGMGATLNMSVSMGAYTLTDRATWMAFGNKANFQIAVQGDKRLFNQYGVILVNPKKHPNVNAEMGQQFIDWLIGEQGQQAIGAFKVEEQSVFFPNADAQSSTDSQQIAQ